jgi:cytochrome c5
LGAAAACCFLSVIADSRAHADGTQQAASSVFDGVFTATQSARGKEKYSETCERCHKEDLRGDHSEEVAPIVGDKFLSEWTQWTVGDLFEFLTTKMPPKRKDREKISDQDYVDALAFILEQNGFPTGSAELPPELDPLLEIEMSRSE